MEEVYPYSKIAGKVVRDTALESLPEVVKDIMKKQPLNPFVKPEIRVLPLFQPLGVKPV